MNLYHSTRSAKMAYTSKEAIRTGIAPDGGLFVSDELDECTIDIAALSDMTYTEIACRVLQTLLPDYTPDEIAACVNEAYTNTFASSEVTPVHMLDTPPAGTTSTGVLELYWGPTSAFKDVALQMLPRLIARAQASTDDAADVQPERIMIVTATSGDTGKAALAGFANAAGTGITVFYPEGKVSPVQELQMSTQEGSNVSVCAVRGNFDDAQSAVKRIFADRELAARLKEAGWVLSSANSINVGRLVPQVVYYFASYAQLLRAGVITSGDAVEFCVPTGNFGDVLAGYYAKLLGLPITKLLVASDKNNVLYDFLTTGVYDRNRPFFTTTSPSMDILISSNLERMLYYLSGKDCELISKLMNDLATTGKFTVSSELLMKIQEVFGCGWADENEVADAIRTSWEANGYLIDPHTACGYHVMQQVPADPHAAARVLLSTASPYKFPRAVLEALGVDAPVDDFACMDALETLTNTTAPQQLAELKTKQVRFTDVVDVAGMGAYVEHACK